MNWREYLIVLLVVLILVGVVGGIYVFVFKDTIIASDIVILSAGQQWAPGTWNGYEVINCDPEVVVEAFKAIGLEATLDAQTTFPSTYVKVKPAAFSFKQVRINRNGRAWIENGYDSSSKDKLRRFNLRVLACTVTPILRQEQKGSCTSCVRAFLSPHKILKLLHHGTTLLLRYNCCLFSGLFSDFLQ